MKLVDRYLLKEHVVPLTYCLAAFCMVFVVYDLFDHLSDFIEAKTPIYMAAFYYVCMLVPAFEYLVPASLLLATLYCLWRFSRNNELTAMRASGISLYRIMVPFLAVGFAFSVFNLVMKETAAPFCADWAETFSRKDYRNVANEPIRDSVYFNRSDRRIWDIGAFHMAEPGRLRNVTVTQERDDGTKATEISADEARYLDGQWWFFNASVQRYRDNESLLGEPEKLGPVREMATLEEEPQDIVTAIKPWEYLTTFQMARHLESHKDLSDKALAQRRYDLHNRIAMPWASLIVTLFAIPGGARSGRHSPMSGIFLAIGFFLGFYALTQIGTFLGKRQIITPLIAAWLSNVVFLTAALVMIRKVR